MKSKKMILAALFAALTCVGTMIIKVPTPTGGYVHPGDGFVLLAGLLLGPLWGGLAAGVGSALGDVLGGYFIYVPGTFVIKMLTAMVAYYMFKAISKESHEHTHRNILSTIVAGIVGEVVMIAGYFLYEIFILSVVSHGTFSAGFAAALVGILPNMVQAIFGVGIATVLYPLLRRITA